MTRASHPADRAGHGAILLDRDGTIIVDGHFQFDPANIELTAGAVEGLVRLTEAGWPLVVLTNQSGIARGYFGQEDAEAFNAALADMLRRNGVEIAGWYLCPHGSGDDCSCRKPRPGMVHEAADALGFDPAASWMIGDKMSDVELAAAIGGRGILVRTGQAGLPEEAAALAAGHAVVDDLAGAADHILAGDRA